MADRKIWTDKEKIPVYIGDDFLKEAYNYFIEGVQNWWTTGKKRVALNNLVEARLKYLGKALTTKNKNEMKKQISTIAKRQQIAAMEEQKLQKELIEAGKADRFSPKGPPAPPAPKPLPKVKEGGEYGPHRFSDPKPVREIGRDRLARDRKLGPMWPMLYSDSESRETKDIFKSVREDQERAVDNPFPYDPWYRKGQYPTGLNTFPDQDMRIKRAVQEELNKPDSQRQTDQRTSSSFDRNKDIFHQIAYGIGKITGQDPSVTYDYPGDPDYNKKKGGKVKKKSKKKTTSKKYSMSRGGIASVRKPTRA